MDARGGLLIFSKKRGYNKKHNKEDTAKKKKKPRALRPKGLLGRAALRFGPSGRRGGALPQLRVRVSGRVCVRVQPAGRKGRKQRQLRVCRCAGVRALRVCAWPVRGPVWGAALRARAPLSRRAAAGGCRVLARLCPVRQSPMYLVP